MEAWPGEQKRIAVESSAEGKAIRRKGVRASDMWVNLVFELGGVGSARNIKRQIAVKTLTKAFDRGKSDYTEPGGGMILFQMGVPSVAAPGQAAHPAC